MTAPQHGSERVSAVEPDAETRRVLTNWAPRMLAQGVDKRDLDWVASTVVKWQQWLPAWDSLGQEWTQIAGEAESAGHGQTAGHAWLRAALAFHFARFVWSEDRSLNRALLERSVFAHRRAMRLLDPDMERIEIPFEQAHVVGNLRRPFRTAAPHRLVLLLPGSDSTKEEFFHWENVFLARGMATFSLDGPGQGESVNLLPVREDYERAVIAAVDVLAERSDIDSQRIGLAGVSLGGYYACRAAAAEPRLQAIIDVSGSYAPGEGRERRSPAAVKMFMDYSWSDTPEQADALLARMTLAGVAEKIMQPLLVVVGGRDRVRDPAQTRRVASEAPHATVKEYEEGNHVCFNVASRVRPFLADWMGDQLSRSVSGGGR